MEAKDMRVVCISNTFAAVNEGGQLVPFSLMALPVVGKVYNVVSKETWKTIVMYELAELEHWWSAKLFRPVTDISDLEKLLTEVPAKELEPVT